MSDAVSGEWGDLHMGPVIQRIAKLAGMAMAEWQLIEPRLPSWPDNMRLLSHVLDQSACSPTVLLFLDDVVVLRHEGHISMTSQSMYTHATRQRIRGKNELVDPSASLNCETLRSIFVTLEALVYKIVHIELEKQRTGYSQRTEAYDARLDRMVTQRLIDEATRALAIEVYETRNQFAHSFLSVDRITYRSEPLADRWGARGTSGQRKFKRYFLADAFELSESLLGRFRPIQSQQVDGDKFRVAINAALADS